MKIVLASNNRNKIREINELLEGAFEVCSLQEAGITEEIPEPYDTFEQNAHAKAAYVFAKTGIPTFAEDSGLVVPALNGAPGVYSARFAGQPTNDAKNTALLMLQMEGIKERAAFYQTVICFVHSEGTHYFSGRCHGSIADAARGTGGFGYDPVFIPEGYEQSFGELDPGIKKAISHRAKAMADFIAFLKQFPKI